MRKVFFLIMVLCTIIACNDDDDGTELVTNETNYNESIDGDLSNDNTAPTSIDFVVGNNRINSSQSDSDVDYFTFNIPTGYVLSQVVIEEYISDDSTAFIGISEGTTFSVDASNRDATNLLGGSLYGSSNVTSNLLPNIGTLQDAQGFSGSLPIGDYSIWLNQTGSTSNAIINFIVSLP